MNAADPVPAPVPILVVTGFLGAGKTTAINAMLHGPHGLRIAAIVNDFGAIDIDAELLAGAADGVVGLRNGCVCCSLQGDLLRTLRTVLAAGPAPDLIVLEASGVADPRGIVDALLDPAIWGAARLDTVLCVLDAADLAETPARRDDPLWRAQVGAADVVLVAKAAGGGVPLPPLPAPVRTVADMGEVLATIRAGGPRRDRADPGARVSDDRFVSLEWRRDEPVPLPAFRAAMDAAAPVLLRAKGFLTFAHAPDDAVLFQMVGRRVVVSPHGGADRGCRLVAVGERGRFDPDGLRAVLDGL